MGRHVAAASHGRRTQRSSPLRSFFSEDLRDRIPNKDILEIIQRVDLMTRASILSHIPGKTADGIWESRYPKPSNDVIKGYPFGFGGYTDGDNHCGLVCDTDDRVRQ